MVVVLNGWAASEHAWDLCKFRRDRIVSYLEEDPELERGTILVGWSLGGNRAIKLAAANADKVKALVLVSPVVRMMKDQGWPGMGEGRLNAFLAAFEMFGGAGMGGKTYPVNPYSADSHEDLLKGLDYLRNSDAREDVKRLDMPVKLFHSEADIISRINNARLIMDTCPQVSAELVPGDEHALPVTIPGKIDAAVEYFANF